MSSLLEKAGGITLGRPNFTRTDIPSDELLDLALAVLNGEITPTQAALAMYEKRGASIIGAAQARLFRALRQAVIDGKLRLPPSRK